MKRRAWKLKQAKIQTIVSITSVDRKQICPVKKSKWKKSRMRAANADAIGRTYRTVATPLAKKPDLLLATSETDVPAN